MVGAGHGHGHTQLADAREGTGRSGRLLVSLGVMVGFLVLEVNSMPAWSGLQKVCEVDIAGAVARGFLAAVRAAHRPRLVVA